MAKLNIDLTKCSILIVDDTPENIDVLVKILEGEGFEVLVAKNGERGLGIATKTMPDLILMDVMMPGIDGYEACRQLKAVEELEEIPVIFLTARSDVEGIVEGFESGGVDYVVKPFKKEELLARIRTNLERAILARELLQLNEQLKAETEAAEQANRAKSAFLANMSHELRTPLNAILGYAQILSKDEELNEKQRSNMATIQHSGEHLLSLITDILDMSKIEAGRIELEPNEFSLPDQLDTLALVFQARAEQIGIQFFYEALTELPVGVRTDERKLRQVLINLLGNAVKFTDEGGVSLKVGYEGAKVRFQVEDTGIGIAPESLAEIFEEFKQVADPNHATEGTGLGLPISSKLVQLLGGELQVKSVLEEGSVFWFELELEEVDGFVQAVEERERRVTGFRGASCKVLVVDDVEGNRSVLVDLLQPLGFEVREAVNGRDGIDQAIDWRPGVILMDLRMPVLDGNAAMREIRRESWGKEVVLIAVTANAFEVNRQASIDAGADGFLAQPFREGQLLDLLAEHLRLEWEYAGEETDVVEEGADSEWILPSGEELSGLMQLSLAGNLLRIGKRVDELLETNAELKPFVLHLRQLVKEFKVREIQEFLRPLAGSGKGPEEHAEKESE